ncbi:hypothetical protein HZH68_004689 [Vespula germanica]|uniref:Uncharacterized protein n=1 Tax=Vespula germanica TaxID=30212 RepID=A0A834KP80_VESGE|nr:hypothetical protein HZH68_004689 [Vespula germanica]
MGSVADRLGPVAVSENMAAKFVQAKGKERRGELGAGRNRQNCDALINGLLAEVCERVSKLVKKIAQLQSRGQGRIYNENDNDNDDDDDDYDYDYDYDDDDDDDENAS